METYNNINSEIIKNLYKKRKIKNKKCLFILNFVKSDKNENKKQ